MNMIFKMKILLLTFALTTVSQVRMFPSNPISIPKLENVKIDGALNDWNNNNAYEIGLLWPYSRSLCRYKDLNASAKVGWDEKGLVLLLNVFDDEFKESSDSSKLWLYDGVEFFLSKKPGDKNLCQWIVTPGMDSLHPHPRWSFVDHRKLTNIKNPDTVIEVARVKRDSSYSLEVRIPWNSMLIDLVSQKEIGFQMWVNDADTNESAAFYNASWFPGLRTAFQPNNMVRLNLDGRKNFDEILVSKEIYDFEKLQPQLYIWARPEYVGDTVKIVSGDEVIYKAIFGKDHLGYSHTSIFLNVDDAIRANLQVKIHHYLSSPIIFKNINVLTRLRYMRENYKKVFSQYKLDTPWDSLHNVSPFILRTRGTAAWVSDFLADSKRVMSAGKFDLQQLTDAIDAIESAGKGVDYYNSCRNSFWSYYYSSTDRSGQPFTIALPKDYDNSKKYALDINLHGTTGRPFIDRTYICDSKSITAFPLGRGDVGYSRLGMYDVLEVISYLKRWYSVDTNRIYLNGTSLGGFGTWYVGSIYPDQFAAISPISGGGPDNHLENVINTPVIVQHGSDDVLVPVGYSRFTADYLQKNNYTYLYKEYTGAGHSINIDSSVYAWKETKIRNEKPLRVIYSTEITPMGSYWVKIIESTDPHILSKIDIAIDTLSKTITIKPENVKLLELDLNRMPFTFKSPFKVNYLNHSYQFKVNRDRRFVMKINKKRIGLVKNYRESKIVPYKAGGLQNLYTDTPLLIVYGTKSNLEGNEVLRKFADSISYHEGNRRKMACGKIPIIADTNLTDIQKQNCNLILVGNPGENMVLNSMYDKLPIRITETGLILKNTKTEISKDGGFGLVYYNPEYPSKLIYIVAVIGSEDNK